MVYYRLQGSIIDVKLAEYYSRRGSARQQPNSPAGRRLLYIGD